MTALSPLDAVFASIALLGSPPAEPENATPVVTRPPTNVVALPAPPLSPRPAPSFFRVFEYHGLDGLVQADWDAAVRLWMAGAPTPAGQWSEAL